MLGWDVPAQHELRRPPHICMWIQRGAHLVLMGCPKPADVWGGP